VHLTWTVDNDGVNAASGAWRDIAYLSSDNVWDVNDKPIGYFDFSGTLQPGGSYTATLDAALPPAVPGTYRIIVRTDIFDDIVETQSSNNTTTSAGVLQVTVPELHLDVPYNTTLDSGEDRLFQVTVPQGQTLQVDLNSSDPNAANTLFLRYGSLPSGATYDAAYQGGVQASQVAVIPSTTAGVYYVLVHGQSESAPGSPVTLVAIFCRSRSPTSRATRVATADMSRPRSTAHSSIRRRSSSWSGPASPNTSRSAIR
jgi:large repetitive protein